MLTEKDYCDYDTCVALKELGYDDSTDLRYNSYGSLGNFLGGIKAPTLYEAQKWLREEKKIDVLVYLDDLKGYFPFIKIWEGFWKTFIILEEMEDKKVSYFVNYEEALSEGVRQAVKILKEK